jgi:dipeptidyl-peptidase-4
MSKLDRLALLVLLLLPAVAHAQGTAADYERATGLRTRFEGKVTGTVSKVVWAADGSEVRYAVETGGKREYVAVTTADGTRKSLTREEFEASPRPTADRPRRGERRRGRTESPDGKWRVTVKDFNLILRDIESEADTPLTTDGTKADAYTADVFWSPDSARFVAHRRTPGGDRVVTLVESSPRDQLQPKTSTYFYLKPGDPIPQARPHLFDIATKKEVPLTGQTKLLANPWDISYEHWSPDGKRFTFLLNPRGHQSMRLLAIDAAGAVIPVINETCKAFFDYSNKLFLQYLDATNELLWMSERSGWNHLYLLDATTGRVKNAITDGAWNVRGVESVDAKARTVRVRLMGRDPAQDPYHVHYATVTFDGTGFTPLTAGDGTHTLDVSPDGKFAVDTYSRVDAAPVSELRRLSDGKRVATLETADLSKLRAAGWQPPERFVAKGRDGTTDIYGVIHRPSNFDPAKTYKVIEYIYAGPHDFFVPKAFRTVHGQAQVIAELGFVVVQMDGMGTNWRSRAFQDVCYKNLGDSGFPDRIPWIKAAAAKYPQLDLAGGVGIFGGSAGGQSSTRALLAFGDFYGVAVSDCGCHDNRMDKIWWNEMWMGWPVGPHYAEQSNVTQAHRLKGKLMLVVGELDRNVDPSSTMQVVNALIKADKDFDLLVVPGAGHGSAESPYGQRRRMDFFVRHLAGKEPRR